MYAFQCLEICESVPIDVLRLRGSWASLPPYSTAEDALIGRCVDCSQCEFRSACLCALKHGSAMVDEDYVILGFDE